MQTWRAMRLPYDCSRIFLFERKRSSTSNGFPANICRRHPKPSFLGAWFPDSFPCKNSCRSVVKNFLRSCFESLAVASHPLQPDSSVQIRVHPWLFIGELFVWRIASCDSPLPVWGEDEGEGTFFFA